MFCGGSHVLCNPTFIRVAGAIIEVARDIEQVCSIQCVSLLMEVDCYQCLTLSLSEWP